MTTDFRALCAELLSEFDYYSDWSDAEEVKERARAALAEPEPVAEESSVAQPAGGEVAELVAWLRETGDLACQADAEEGQRYWSAADLLERPKPPSLKEQALKMLADVERFTEGDYYIIRRALEQLDD